MSHPDSTKVMGRTTLVDTVPMGYGRPRGDATTCPMDESMTSRPTVIEPGNAGRGGGGRVIQKITECKFHNKLLTVVEQHIIARFQNAFLCL